MPQLFGSVYLSAGDSILVSGVAKKKRVEPKPEATDEERAQTTAKLRQFIETLRASR
jgi:hypothetical protein